MRRRTANIVLERGVVDTLPTAEEVVLRPELVKEMLRTIVDKVDDMDIEHMVAIGVTPAGAPIVFHSYGKDLPMKRVANMLEDLARQARKAKT